MNRMNVSLNTTECGLISLSFRSFPREHTERMTNREADQSTLRGIEGYIHSIHWALFPFLRFLLRRLLGAHCHVPFTLSLSCDIPAEVELRESYAISTSSGSTVTAPFFCTAPRFRRLLRFCFGAERIS